MFVLKDLNATELTQAYLFVYVLIHIMIDAELSPYLAQIDSVETGVQRVCLVFHTSRRSLSTFILYLLQQIMEYFYSFATLFLSCPLLRICANTCTLYYVE